MAPRGRGELKFRVRFDKKIAATDTAGGTSSDWSTAGTGSFTRWASINPLQGREEVMAQRLTGVQPVEICVEYDSQTVTLDPSWRAVELRDAAEVKPYAMKTVEDMERDRKYITILAVAGAADA